MTIVYCHRATDLWRTEEAVSAHLPSTPSSSGEGSNQAARPCGCGEGAAGGFGALGAYIVVLAVAGLGPLTWWTAAAVGFGLFAGGVAIGKAFGIRRAERRLNPSIGASVERREPGPIARSSG
jgi:hypothetical protein